MEGTDKRIYLVEQHLKEIQKDIANISTALIGNKENGNRGFIHELKELRHDVTELNIKVNDMTTEITKKDLYISKLEYGLYFIIGAVITIIIKQIIK